MKSATAVGRTKNVSRDIKHVYDAMVPGAYFVRFNERTCPHNLTKSIIPAYDPNMNIDSTTVRQSNL